MKKGTNFDISLTRTETLYLLKPDKYEKSISDNHNKRQAFYYKI